MGMIVFEVLLTILYVYYMAVCYISYKNSTTLIGHLKEKGYTHYTEEYVKSTINAITILATVLYVCIMFIVGVST